MRYLGLTVLAMVAALAGSAQAVDHERFIDVTGKDIGIPRHPAYDRRDGGERIPSAIPIQTLPFTDQGATCDNVDDYDAACPYSGSSSRDVVYKYSPRQAERIAIDLCGSAYDTKVYVYQWPDLYTAYACNDDAGCGYSGWQSKIRLLDLEAGGEYFIVVDGYGGDCGAYALLVTPFEECTVECPPRAMQEGEPPCHDGYYDSYNGG